MYLWAKKRTENILSLNFLASNTETLECNLTPTLLDDS